MKRIALILLAVLLTVSFLQGCFPEEEVSQHGKADMISSLRLLPELGEEDYLTD